MPPMLRGQVFQHVTLANYGMPECSAYIDPANVVFIEPADDQPEGKTIVTLESGVQRVLKGNVELITHALQGGRQMASELLLEAMIESIRQTITKEQPEARN